MAFSDHFSAVADAYAAHRPGYPEALFSWLSTLTRDHKLAWDCACGSGQTARSLKGYFERVVATDASEAQIRHAEPDPQIEYRVALADASGLHGKSVDLVTISQALHWLDVEKFYAEVRRVAKPGGVLATWAFGRIGAEDAKLHAAIKAFQSGTLSGYWPKEVAHIHAKYRSLPFPFEEIEAPSFTLQATWTLQHLLGYLRSTSAASAYMKANGADPVSAAEKEMAAAWGNASEMRVIIWANFFMRVGRIF